APGAQVIHADIDPAEIGKNRPVDVPIVGDLKEVLTELDATLRGQDDSGALTAPAAWVAQLDALRAAFPLGYGPQSDGSLSPEYVLARLTAAGGRDAVYCAGGGQHARWAPQFVDDARPRPWLSSGGLGTMGYAVPAATGAQLGRPDAEVWSIDGDGCSQMPNQELATCAIEGAPIKVAVINNGNLGMVRQWQTLFYEERYSQTRSE